MKKKQELSILKLKFDSSNYTMKFKNKKEKLKTRIKLKNNLEDI
jgi:hypothetical protein